jgi:ectoine hydroxylase
MGSLNSGDSRDAESAAPGPLTDSQIAEFRENGYLLLPPGFIPDRAIDIIHDALPGICAQEGPERILERDGQTVRSVYGLHQSEPRLKDLAALRPLCGAAQQLLNDDVYVHQSKVNFKESFAGDQWEWHQDYIYWLRYDGLPRPDLLNAAIFLDEVNEFNGALTFVPGSHSQGILSGHHRAGMPTGYEDAPNWVSTLTAEEQFSIDPAVIGDLATRYGLVSPKGGTGSVLLFHPDILHASGPNISPFRRAMMMFVYNAVGNRPELKGEPRPAFLAEPDITPLQPQDLIPGTDTRSI